MRDAGQIWRAATAVGLVLGTATVLVAPPAVAAPVNYDILITPGNGGGQDIAYTVPAGVCAIAWKVFGGSNLAPSDATINGTFTGTGSGKILGQYTACPTGPVTPNAGPPDAPTALTAAARNGSATLTFTPGADNGSPITGYEYSLDGDTWQTFPTADGAAGTRSGTVTGLSNGNQAAIRIRARNAAGPSPATAAATVTPTAPPAAPAGVSAVAGTSSITVTWTAAPAGGAPVTGYTAIASPGPATCSTLVSDPAPTSCVLGAEAGVTYTITVVANSASGDSPPAGPSTAVVAAPPAAPAAPPATNLTLTTDKGRISTAEPGQQIVVIGTGFAPHSTATITIYSTPVNLGTVITDADGNFSKPVTVPASLADGTHTVLAQGAAPDGSLRSMALAVTVDTTSTTLAVTGHNLTGLALAGLTALLVGAAMLHLARPARRYRRVLPFGVAHS
ncbi:fibronectin type III domain-containing protein [Dactylosporangium sp. NPDC049525]|uniref:fibronectin type III domain-containing protein n=1 Tax=Dactylosporangium sp. NPDC049525 TaxID=3154730 RepID=UPI00342F65FE